MKKISIVYQDCPMCGTRYNWGLKQLNLAHTNGMELVKVPFYTDKGREYCAEAVQRGIGSFPFFTDGEKYSLKLDDFIEKPTQKAKKAKKGEK